MQKQQMHMEQRQNRAMRSQYMVCIFSNIQPTQCPSGLALGFGQLAYLLDLGLLLFRFLLCLLGQSLKLLGSKLVNQKKKDVSKINK